MKKIAVILSILIFCGMTYAQYVYFEEHFEEGDMSDQWFNPWGENGVDMEPIPRDDAPDEDGFVGSLSNSGMVGTSLAGTMDLTDYKIESMVFVTVEQGVRHGICARFDTTGGTASFEYYYLRANFNTTQMPPSSPELELRIYPGGTGVGEDLLAWAADDLPGGTPEDESWHKLGLEVKGDSLWAYWDDEMLDGCPVIDDELTAGFFGVYVFAMGEEVVTLSDAIVVTMDVEENIVPPENVVATLDQSFGLVTITWEQPDDALNDLQHFEIYRNEEMIDTTMFETYTDTLTEYGTFNYYLQSVFQSGTSEASESAEVIYELAVGDKDQPESPISWKLSAAYPNPFNPSTNITVESPGYSSASVSVYDLTGRWVTDLLSGSLPAGGHELTFNANGLTAGIYFVILEAQDVRDIRKVVLLK